MEDLVFLNKNNFDEILRKIDFHAVKEISASIEDFINHAPFMSDIISHFMIECITNNILFKEAFEKILISKTDDPDIDLSKCIYATYLGANTNITSLKSISSVYKYLTINSSQLEKYQGLLDNFYCSSILKELKFSLRDCIDRLLIFPPEPIIYAIQKEQSYFNLSVLIQMSNYLDFFKVVCDRIHQFCRKNEIIACILINHFSFFNQVRSNCPNQRGLEEKKALFKQLIQSDVLEYCLKLVNREQLSTILEQKFEDPKLNKITFEVFKDLESEFKNKSEFFDAFVLLTSPSVSHFLSYLELFKSKFKLSDKDQREFVSKLKNFHLNNTAYLDIIKEKLIKFKIIKDKNFQ